MNTKDRMPQDELYGPIKIPGYCWPIIDTVEFQRLRNISQLGAVTYVYPGANYSAFEHALGCCHLAQLFMDHITEAQPELNVTEEMRMCASIGALCHDLGRGPFGVVFERFAHEYDPDWSTKTMSEKLLRFIVKKYGIAIPQKVVDGACGVITGSATPICPEWVSQIVSGSPHDIDLNKFDYLSRDANRTITGTRFEYDRLIYHCRILDGKLSWRMSEVATIERVLFHRNDMHGRVYTHRVAQAVEFMIQDIFDCVSRKFNFDAVLDDPARFSELDDRILYMVEHGEYDSEAKQIAEDLKYRRLYKCVGELRVAPHNEAGRSYSQLPPTDIQDDIKSLLEDNDEDVEVRVSTYNFRYGLRPKSNPLKFIPFWREGSDKPVFLKDEDLSYIMPAYYLETAMRVFVTDSTKVEKAKAAFEKWKKQRKL